MMGVFWCFFSRKYRFLALHQETTPMPDEGHFVITPHRTGRLKFIGLAVLIAAAAAAVWGILSRRSDEAALNTWTQQQATPTVSVQHPDTDTAPGSLTLPGDVQAFYDAPIYARVPGYLRSWTQDIGAHVKAGQTLGTIETPELDQELAQAEADLASAKAQGALADLTARRWHALLASNAVSQQSVDEKEGNALAQHATVTAQQAHVDRLLAMSGFKRLAAPFDGIVTARNTDVGALINPGPSEAHPLFRVADTHEMRVYVNVPQAYASQLKTGLKATLTQPQYPGVEFPATLATTSQSVNAESRTVLTELMAANPGGKLWPGTYAEVHFQLPPDPNVLRVPASALIFRNQGAQVAIVTPDNHIDLKDVVIGRNLGTVIEIRSGVTAHDRIVVSPLDTISQGEAVDVSEAPAAPAVAAE
jgi:RND family efflux transporter MFP subunit